MRIPSRRKFLELASTRCIACGAYRRPVIVHSKRFFHQVEDSDREDDTVDLKYGRIQHPLVADVKRTRARKVLGQILKGFGLAGGVVAALLCIGLGDMMDERYYKNEVNDDQVFIEGTADDMMKNQLRDGDVLFFHRKFFSYNPIHMMKIGLYKLGIKDSGWTHVAIVVRDVEEENEPYVVECGWNGIQVTPYDMRIATSQCDAIQYRHLRTEYTFDQVHALNDWMNEMRLRAENNEGERITWRTVIRRLWTPPQSTVALHGEMGFMRYNIQQMQKKIDDPKTNEYEKQKQMKTIKMLKTKITWLKDEIRRRKPGVQKRLNSHFPDCRVVAEGWQALGIIPEDGPEPKEYLPRHFVADLFLPFSQIAYLDEPTYVRTLDAEIGLESGAIFDQENAAARGSMRRDERKGKILGLSW